MARDTNTPTVDREGNPIKKQPPGGNKNGKNGKKGNGSDDTDSRKAEIRESLETLSNVTSQMGKGGGAHTPSASNVRSGASHGAKAIDPWRSFSTESGSPNDNN